ncbi:class I SAM-dependent methyltransferase [Microbacterium sp.]|uniref:class I SAM-dependent methyltransferase n=1 Tax=Microbacterium sp. TaxID=51671 RepID=UPI002B94F602|nr:methyltransferase [Microbacterium sp.]HWK76791.1 methyltransferase [Microbacterium sp.]
MDFSYAALRRFPDVEAPNLQAWDATDELLVARALVASMAGDEIAVIGDEYGAITLALADAGMRGIRVHQDLATGRRALVRNAAALGFRTAGASVECELGPELLEGARLVLLQLPKSLAELEEIVDAVARWAAPDVTLIAGGRVKHMTLTQNEVLGRSFETVQPQRAERKSRLIVATGARDVPAEPPYPVTSAVEAPGLDRPLTLVAHGGAFAGSKLDIGTRVLLEVLAFPAQLRRNAADGPKPGRDDANPGKTSGVMQAAVTETVVDLGCGTGALAATYALTHPGARIIATDRSAAAVASARATMAANRITAVVTHDDAGSEIPDQSADLVLLNPPFHLGASIHTGAAIRLFEAAARILKPGGELLTVYNSHLAYKQELNRTIGPTQQLHRTPKFTVTRSIRQ